jgi:hypothetical protein
MVAVGAVTDIVVATASVVVLTTVEPAGQSVTVGAQLVIVTSRVDMTVLVIAAAVAVFVTVAVLGTAVMIPGFWLT